MYGDVGIYNPKKVGAITGRGGEVWAWVVPLKDRNLILWDSGTGYSKIIKNRKNKKYKFGIDLAIDYKFWSSGFVNLNFHNGFTFEIEFLCFGLYISMIHETPIT